MSHKASSWLAEIPADLINAGAFRVLFHLCDAHNSKRPYATACFPSQELLRRATGLSNGGLNNALNSIEGAGLMRRRRTRNPDGTKGPTYYILGCDVDLSIDPTPENGDGTISNLEDEPSPNSGINHLHSTGDKPVIEPVKEPVNARDRAGDLFSAENEQESQADRPDADFERFWNVYPKKAAKKDAQKAWAKAVKRETPDRIVSAAERYAAWLAAPCRPGEFKPHPKNAQGWLNGDRWQEFLDQPLSYRWDDLTQTQKNQLGTGNCPRSMMDENGQPNEVAAYWLAQMRRAS